MTPHDPSPELPDVDERLVAPNTRYEIEDGKVVYVPPADEPHGTSHAKLAALLETHRGPTFSVAVDMLTRTSRIDDIAPDVSVFPTARDARTGRRQLEQLAFEIARSESLAHAGGKAAKLVARGVRRVFAVDLERGRALEWSAELGEWSILDQRMHIDDPALAVPLPVAALLDAARADISIARALRARRHPEFVAEHDAGRAEGRAEGREEGREEGRAEGVATGMVRALLAVLAGRQLEPTAAERERILSERDPDRLERWLAAAVTCTSISALFAEP
jgi:hypothetical protein